MELVQVAQHAVDLERAASFYEMLLGQKPIATFDPPGLVFFRLGRTRLLLDRVAPSALLYLAVEDVRVRIEELAARSVTVDTPPHQIFTHEDDSLGPAGHDEWQAFIKDSEGNLVGLVSQHAI
jgi:predicted enzyme related to lactoylglutathione lyase